MVKPIGLITFGAVSIDSSRARTGPWDTAAIGHTCSTLPLTLHTGPNTRHLQRTVRWECYK